jgi:hypothetical protein
VGVGQRLGKIDRRDLQQKLQRNCQEVTMSHLCASIGRYLLTPLVRHQTFLTIEDVYESSELPIPHDHRKR